MLETEPVTGPGTVGTGAEGAPEVTAETGPEHVPGLGPSIGADTRAGASARGRSAEQVAVVVGAAAAAAWGAVSVRREQVTHAEGHHRCL